MIEISLIVSENNTDTEIKVMKNHRLTLNENSVIEFRVHSSIPSYIDKPMLCIGDVPLDLYLLHENEEGSLYTSKKSNEFYHNQHFLNFFGESEISIRLEKENINTSFICDILARRANAAIANEMLDYLSLHVDDVVKLCFSRTKKGASLNDKRIDSSFTKLSITHKIIEQISKDISLFKKYKSTKWESNTTIKEQATSIGPDSIYYVMNNVDSLTSTTYESANICANGRYYYLDKLPSEDLIESTNTDENRQIHFLFLSISLYLRKLKSDLTITTTKVQTSNDIDYLQFDDVLNNFKISILKRKIHDIDKLLFEINKIIYKFNTLIPAKVLLTTKPRLTHYIKKTPHYSRLFILMDKWFKSPSPNLNGSELLLGVKNLSKLYEYTCLILLNNIIKNDTKLPLETATYLNYHDDGSVSEEKIYENNINNYYSYSNESMTINLLYEPFIYAYSKNSKPNTLVNISGKSNNKNPDLPHYYAPDFIIEISKNSWDESIYMILDAKFTNRSNVKDLYLPEITNKYLFGIHKTRNDLTLGISPIKAVIALFPHSTHGNKINNTGKDYCLTGKNPVIPHASGQIFIPNKTTFIRQSIFNLIKIIDNS
ncbi:hypothetical protein C9J21_15410 [Photobacterium phosphoreum]|uniref:nuclease domain-containing protein n=1 Tax=Photobacterium phosphoreum TaxID=659 RepID=UPI000D15CF13|nr:nuclease domain-containing protein [Photobacterium phosphoreum]PSW31711.1 hypothetical protein C9J21_15410 [Photobacterium phosphoreum]